MLRLAILLCATTLLVSGSVVRHRKLHKTVRPFSPVGECPGHQDGPPTYLPDSERCDIYYECSNGDAVQNVCPGELQWNPISHVCDFPDVVNCHQGDGNSKPKVVRPSVGVRTCTKGVPYSAVGTCPVPQGSIPVYLPDSEDCTIFYECDESGNACLKQCPSGTGWNPTLNACDLLQNVDCSNKGLKLAIQVKPKTVDTFSPVGECPGHQDGPPTYLPDSERCDIYYECSNGDAVQNVCPGELQWNPISHVCDFPDVVNCQQGDGNSKTKVVRPSVGVRTCTKGVPYSAVGTCPVPQGSIPVYLPDSEDCTIFYECDESGNACQKQCPSGTAWNPTLNACDLLQNVGCSTKGQQHKVLMAHRRMSHFKRH